MILPSSHNFMYDWKLLEQDRHGEFRCRALLTEVINHEQAVGAPPGGLSPWEVLAIGRTTARRGRSDWALVNQIARVRYWVAELIDRIEFAACKRLRLARVSKNEDRTDHAQKCREKSSCAGHSERVNGERWWVEAQSWKEKMRLMTMWLDLCMVHQNSEWMSKRTQDYLGRIALWLDQIFRLYKRRA